MRSRPEVSRRRSRPDDYQLATAASREPDQLPAWLSLAQPGLTAGAQPLRHGGRLPQDRGGGVPFCRADVSEAMTGKGPTQEAAAAEVQLAAGAVVDNVGQEQRAAGQADRGQRSFQLRPCAHLTHRYQHSAQ